MKRNTLVILSLLCTVFFIDSCSKELSLENNVLNSSAEGSLWDSTKNCLPDSVFGTFYTGVQPGSDTAFVEIKVNVAAAGSYIISSDLQNGFMFADSGFFTTKGINTVRLKPSGTPLVIKPTVFTIAFDSSVCNFFVDVKDSTGHGTPVPDPVSDSTNFSDTAWQFNVGAGFYHGQIDTAFVVDTLGLKYLTLVGSNTPSGDTSFLMGILLLSGNIMPGTYTTSLEAGVYLTTLQPPSTPVTIYHADGTTATSGIVTITIISYDSTSGILEGTFSGTAVDDTGNPVTITNGAFKVKIS
ncbi:MAG: hypothetical protein ABI861_06830 [Panacibacter sp.]